MNFIDFIIIAIVLTTLGLIVYFNFIRKSGLCPRCPGCYASGLSSENFLVAIEKSNDFSYAIKKDKDVCSKCAYRREKCDCGKRKQ